MSLNILDTDTLSHFERGHTRLIGRVVGCPLSQIAITIITIDEQFAGRQAYIRRARTDAEIADAYLKLTNTVRVVSGFHILSFSEGAVQRYRLLLALGLNIGGMDLRIAAIALEEEATVITRNLRDFERVPHLKCENWAD